MMMTENNYEEYVLDYLEGNLDPAKHQAMELFLSTRSDIAAELHGLEEAIITPDPQMRFEPKASLKKRTGIAWAIGWRLLVVIAFLLVSIGGTLIYYQIPTNYQQPASGSTVVPAAETPATAATVPQGVSEVSSTGSLTKTSTTAPITSQETPISPSTTPAETPAASIVPAIPRRKQQTPIPSMVPAHQAVPPTVQDTVQKIMPMAHQEGPRPNAQAPIEQPTPLPTHVLATVEPHAIQVGTQQQQEALLRQPIALVEAPKQQTFKQASGIWKLVAQAIVPESFVQDDWN